MRAAAIDLGTNTFHLIIADVSHSEVSVVYKTNVPVRLGEGRINENIIIPAAYERGLQTLTEFAAQMKKHDVETVMATATSAVRSAKNGVDFVNDVKSRAGIAINIITGDQEASFIFQGVKATGVIDGVSLIMDIGGGSTEFIICNRQELLWKKSYNIGAARLMQAHFKSDPISSDEKQHIIEHLDEVLADLKAACRVYKPEHLIGSAGAFETFTAMLLKGVDIAGTKSAALDVGSYLKLSKMLISSTHAEREEMPDLIKLRVDMIVIAAIITNYIIEHCQIKHLSLSTYDLKMGVLYSLIPRN